MTVAGAAEPPAKDWFAKARFGIQLPAEADARVWIPRIAAAGAKYVVAGKPDDQLANLAQQHHLILLDRADYPNLGQRIPSSVAAAHWEARFPLTDSTDAIRLLSECAGKGGNLLLTLPPDTERSAAALTETGRWLQRNGESIFGTTAGPFDRMPFFGRATAKGNTLYIHLYQWPANGTLRLTGLRNAIAAASVLGSRESVTWAGTELHLPPRGPEDAVNVVKVELNAPPAATPYLIEPAADGVVTAPAESCEFETKPGQIIRKELREGRVVLAHWTRAIDVPSWKVHIPGDGRYAVEMVYQAAKESAGITYTVTMKGSTMGMVKGVVEETGSRSKPMPVNDMVLEAGNYMLFVQPENKPGQPAMQLEKILLRRIGN